MYIVMVRYWTQWQMQDFFEGGGGSVIITCEFLGHTHFSSKPRPFLREASYSTCQSISFRSRSLLRHAEVSHSRFLSSLHRKGSSFLPSFPPPPPICHWDFKALYPIVCTCKMTQEGFHWPYICLIYSCSSLDCWLLSCNSLMEGKYIYEHVKLQLSLSLSLSLPPPPSLPPSFPLSPSIIEHIIKKLSSSIISAAILGCIFMNLPFSPQREITWAFPHHYYINNAISINLYKVHCRRYQVTKIHTIIINNVNFVYTVRGGQGINPNHPI